MPTADVRIDLPERYRVVRHIANGGMASVWRAEDSVLGRLVAVKVLTQHVAADPSARTRFEREARTAARVSDHPNVVTIYDVGEHGGIPFIVMELLSGGTVADRLRVGRPAQSRVFAWLQQAAAALDYAHGENIVHRDVKPANLLLDDRERLAVADFGIARVADETNLTAVGQVLGTAAYLSPEQASGEQATAASDRYALGVVAYELLCGRRPFQGEHIAAQARQHIESDVPDSGLGPEVDDVLRRAMAKDPDARYPTAARFVEEIEAVSARIERPTEATRAVAAAPPPPAPTPAATPPPPRRRDPLPPPAAPAPGPQRGGGWKLLAGLAVLAAVVAVAAIVLAGGGDPEPQSASDRQATQEQPQDEQAAPQQTEEEPATPAPAQTQAPDNEPETGAGPVSEGNESPSQLDARGFALVQQGKPQEAVPLLEQAVKGFEAQGDAADPTGYGYALYNLGTAYLESGRAADAIPLFERRLEVSPDDRPGVVRKSLKRAQREAGQG